MSTLGVNLLLAGKRIEKQASASCNYRWMDSPPVKKIVGAVMTVKITNSFKKRALRMRRSKLEMYADILRVLAKRGPLITTHIMQKANIDSKALKEYAKFLIKQGLVEERSVKEGRIIFEITPRGVLVLKGLKELEKVLLPLSKKLAYD